MSAYLNQRVGLKKERKPCALLATPMEAESSGVELKESVVVIEPR